jgi:hypothetical protein
MFHRVETAAIKTDFLGRTAARRGVADSQRRGVDSEMQSQCSFGIRGKQLRRFSRMPPATSSQSWPTVTTDCWPSSLANPGTSAGFEPLSDQIAASSNVNRLASRSRTLDHGEVDSRWSSRRSSSRPRSPDALARALLVRIRRRGTAQTRSCREHLRSQEAKTVKENSRNCRGFVVRV